MKIVNTVKGLVRGSTLIALMALAAAAGTAEAATIKMECKVKGYSLAGWIEVRPGSNTGGRVMRDQSGRSYTDRVQRGETMRITYEAQTRGEACHGGSWGGIFKTDHGYHSQADFGKVRLPHILPVTCPTDPNWDNVRADIETSLGYFSKRIPIGSR